MRTHPVKIRRTLLALITMAIATMLCAGPSQAAGTPIAAFSLAAPLTQASSGLVARAVVARGVHCPTLDVVVDSRMQHRPMRERMRPSNTGSAFSSITVCSSPIPRRASEASISGIPIPAAMPTSVHRLAMLADSGCRIQSSQVQDCSDIAQWPLAAIANSVSNQKPDAIIFNGDFFYRESACPTDHQSWCGSSPPPVKGMPFTDSAYGWIADALLPMTPMFQSAPLIVTRGNHEACYRGGNGFFYLFDSLADSSNTCAPIVSNGNFTAAPTVPKPTYAVDLQVTDERTLRLLLVDSAGGSDTSVTAFADLQRPAYERAAKLAKPQPGRESWLLTHRPVYGFVSTELANPGQPFSPWTSYDQGAAAWGLLDRFDLVFSSHLHQAQAMQLPGLPGQLVLGNAGALLDDPTGYPLPTEPYTVGPDRTYPSPTSAWLKVKFGFAIATPNAAAGSWTMRMLDDHGAEFARCDLAHREISCVDR